MPGAFSSWFSDWKKYDVFLVVIERNMHINLI